MRASLLLALLAPGLSLATHIPHSTRMAKGQIRSNVAIPDDTAAAAWVQAAKYIEGINLSQVTEYIVHLVDYYVSLFVLPAYNTTGTSSPAPHQAGVLATGVLSIPTLQQIGLIAKSRAIINSTLYDAVEYYRQNGLQNVTGGIQIPPGPIDNIVNQVLTPGLRAGMITSIGHFIPPSRNMSTIVNATAVYGIICEPLNLTIAGVSFVGNRMSNSSTELNWGLLGIGVKPTYNMSLDTAWQPSELMEGEAEAMISFEAAITYAQNPTQSNGYLEFLQGKQLDTFSEIALVCGSGGCYYQIVGLGLGANGTTGATMLPASRNSSYPYIIVNN